MPSVECAGPNGKCRIRGSVRGASRPDVADLARPRRATVIVVLAYRCWKLAPTGTRRGHPAFACRLVERVGTSRSSRGVMHRHPSRAVSALGSNRASAAGCCRGPFGNRAGVWAADTERAEEDLEGSSARGPDGRCDWHTSGVEDRWRANERQRRPSWSPVPVHRAGKPARPGLAVCGAGWRDVAGEIVQVRSFVHVQLQRAGDRVQDALGVGTTDLAALQDACSTRR